MTDFKPVENALYFVVIFLSIWACADFCWAESPQQEKSPHQIGDRSLAGEVSPVQEKQAISQQPQSNTLPADKKPFSFLSNQAASGPGKNPAKQEPVTTSDALSVSIGLIFILLLIFSLAWFMRKMGYSNISGQGQLSILATLNLGQKEKIILLQVGQQQMLVGITATQINTLHVLKEPLESIETQAGKEDKSHFANKLTEILKSYQPKNGS